MSREFGLYPTNREPQLWIGCRAIITDKVFDVPWGRWSEDIKYESGRDDFVWWINNVAIPKIEMGQEKAEKSFGLALRADFILVKLTIEIAVVICIAAFIPVRHMTI